MAVGPGQYPQVLSSLVFFFSHWKTSILIWVQPKEKLWEGRRYRKIFVEEIFQSFKEKIRKMKQRRKVNKKCIGQKGPGIERRGNFFQNLEKAQKMQLRITN